MRKASTRLPEQGTQTPSPAPDLIPAEPKNQPRTHIAIGTANGGTSVCKRLFNITAQLAPYRVLTYSICSAKIRLPLFKDRTKVEKDEVVICDGQVGRVLIVGC